MSFFLFLYVYGQLEYLRRVLFTGFPPFVGETAMDTYVLALSGNVVSFPAQCGLDGMTDAIELVRGLLIVDPDVRTDAAGIGCCQWFKDVVSLF